MLYLSAQGGHQQDRLGRRCFKYVPISIDCNMEDPYWHLLDVIGKITDHDALYFIDADKSFPTHH